MFKRLYYIILQRLYVLKNKNKPCQGKVYMFHNVNDEQNTYAINKENFRTFVEYLVKNKKVVDIETLIREKDPDNVVITFDDVYESVYQNAYPILKEKGLPFYLFLCDEYLNKENYVSSDMVKKMLRDSKAILGSHRMKHELSRFSDETKIREDMKESKEKLEQEFGVKVDAFAFPFGSMYACSEKNIEDALEIYKYVFMTYPISYDENMKRVLPRINMNDVTFEREIK